MSWTLLAPAVAIVTTFGALAWSMHRIDRELVALRASLRRSRATGVALVELERDTVRAVREAERIDHSHRARADLRRARRRSRRR